MGLRRGLFGTQEEHAKEALSFYNSASNNFARHRDSGARSSCHNIEHMTDVITEANIAVIAASHAGDKALENKASKLAHDATLKQRELLTACRLRERALAVTGQEGNYNPRRRRR